ncbi:unnamed protein product [Closterium sp. NIES-54]
MDSVLREVECTACYIDDVVIFSTSEQQHLQDVERILAAIEAARLTCHPNKCRWGEQTVQYLGYEVKGGQIGIQQAKVEQESGGTEWVTAGGQGVGVWRSTEGGAADLMTAVKTAAVLKLPAADHPFTLYTDWSSQGMGGILCQEVEGEEKVVAYGVPTGERVHLGDGSPATDLADDNTGVDGCYVMLSFAFTSVYLPSYVRVLHAWYERV